MTTEKSHNQPSRLGDLIENLVKSSGQSSQFYGWRVVSRWPDLVGPEIARISKAVRFSEGILTVVVEKDVWRQELEMQLEEILARIWQQPGGNAVRKIVLKAGKFSE